MPEIHSDVLISTPAPQAQQEASQATCRYAKCSGPLPSTPNPHNRRTMQYCTNRCRALQYWIDHPEKMEAQKKRRDAEKQQRQQRAAELANTPDAVESLA